MSGTHHNGTGTWVSSTLLQTYKALDLESQQNQELRKNDRQYDAYATVEQLIRLKFRQTTPAENPFNGTLLSGSKA